MAVTGPWETDASGPAWLAPLADFSTAAAAIFAILSCWVEAARSPRSCIPQPIQMSVLLRLCSPAGARVNCPRSLAPSRPARVISAVRVGRPRGQITLRPPAAPLYAAIMIINGADLYRSV